MITGFNTDIVYQGVTYHVQTEDKGTATPLILSLVYNGGTILASKRSPYDDLLLEKFDEKVLAERLQRQHKLICAAISSGRIEDLKRMSVRPSAKQTPDLAVKNVELLKTNIPPKIEQTAKPETVKIPEPEKQEPKIGYLPKFDVPQPQILNNAYDSAEEISNEQAFIDLEQILDEERIEARRRAEVPIPKPDPKIWEAEKSEPPTEEIIIEAVEIIEDVEIISAEAVEIVEEKTSSQKFLEELERAQIEAGAFGDDLTVKVLSDEEFYSGDEKTIEIVVFQGTLKNVLGGAHIMVKVLGSAFSPALYHAKTDNMGMATVHLKIPVFAHGRAVVMIKAMSGGDEAEYRKIIKTR